MFSRPLALLSFALLAALQLSTVLSEESRRVTPAAEPPAKDRSAEWIKGLSWRCIGPAAMGGRIVALSVYEADPSTYWVATASGGLLKTVNNGITFEHQFDREATVSIGDVCVAPSDRNVVWVGTGENNPRNSVSWGDGVYKSTDGGKTWKNMGLKKSFQIGRIVVHPKDPNTVYVGALGRLYGPSEERGLYKTTDGGQTWSKVLFVDERTGVIDVQMNPADPEELLVATYERQRDGYDSNDPAKKWGPGSGLYRTSDGGKTFHRIRKGLPTCSLGRMGLCYYRKHPHIVYAVIESERIGMGPAESGVGPATLGLSGKDVEDAGVRLTGVEEDGPAWKAGLRSGDLVVAVGDTKVRSFAALLRTFAAHKAGDRLEIKVEQAGKARTLELTVPASRIRQPALQRPYAASLGGQQANIQDKQGGDGFECGGVFRSADGGESWSRVNSLNPRPMYFSQIRIDPSDDRRIYVLGISLHRSSDGGKTFQADVRGIHGDHHALWIDPHDGRHVIVGNDGGTYVSYDRMAHWDRLNQVAIGQLYHVGVDSRRPYRVYGGLQDNGIWGGPSRTRTEDGPVNEDWVRLKTNDGFVCRVDPDDPDLVYYETQWGRFVRRDLRSDEAVSLRPPRSGSYRFNWNAPFLLSHHNPRIFYGAANVVFRSLDRGNDLRPISSHLPRTEQGSVTALAESPRNADVLWAGTDDGYLWLTRDGGRHWSNLTANVGLPGPRWVANVEASRFREGRAYVAFDGHRSDDDEPYVFVTEDFGKTWKSLRGNLPTGSTRVLLEDVRNPDLLFLGTEFAAWASLDRGGSWVKLNTNLPTVAVHDFAFAPNGEVVAATHGRSVWVLDATPLRQMTPAVLHARAHLFEPARAIRWRQEPDRGGTPRRFVGENPPSGAVLTYALAERANRIRLRVVDYTGKTVRELSASRNAGLHRVVWDLMHAPEARRSGEGPAETEGVPVAAGMYRVILEVDGKELSQGLRVEVETGASSPAAAP